MGIDVGIVYEDGKYWEDYNEGWLSKYALLNMEEREAFNQDIASSYILNKNNLAAFYSFNDFSIKFNSFTITGKRVTVED